MKRWFGKDRRRSGATPNPRRRDEDVRPRPHAAHPKPSGATGRHSAAQVSAYFLQHLQVFFYSLGQMSRSPMSTLMTAAVIGIALALPTALHVALQNSKSIGAAWDGSAQISLFLRPEISDTQAARLAGRIRAFPGIAEVTVITHAEALAEFRQLSGFGAALNILQENPLPAVLVILPQPSTETGLGLAPGLIARLRALPEVEIAEFDMQWLKRLYAIMALAQRGVFILSALLGLAVLLIVGNTIRLMIQSRRDEIEIVKLIGATDAFIRRPFLYSGLWYGLLGVLIAWLLVNVSLWLLREPVRQLAALYNNDFELAGLNTQTTLLLLGTGVLLGLLGSLLAVKRHLAAIEPL
ncbi:MAG: permease-like cell division protein FtsX [Gammaproteobacteria bacterium]